MIVLQMFSPSVSSSTLLRCLSPFFCIAFQPGKKKQTQKNQGNGVPPAHIVPFFFTVSAKIYPIRAALSFAILTYTTISWPSRLKLGAG